MSEERDSLYEDLKHFQREQERIRAIVGRIGGKDRSRANKLINRTFIVLIVLLFVVDLLRHFLSIEIILPPLFFMEVSILLISVKIILMISQQTRVEHFQFWILHSIEFRLNEISTRIRKIEEKSS
jgi:hypothetical protein